MTQPIQHSTQPTDCVDSQSQEIPEIDSWAQLSCNVGIFKRSRKCHWIKQNVFKVGRLETCDHVFRSEEHHKSILIQTSKVHFIIERRSINGTSVGFIRDLSSNGTFINSDHIGRNNCRVLAHKDVISVCQETYKLFTFRYVPANGIQSIPNYLKMNYHVVNEIGSGGFSEVYYVLNKKTCESFAMEKATINTNIHLNYDVFAELKVFESIKHNNIVKMYDKMMNHNELFLILEYMNGGDLRQRLRDRGNLPELVARHIFKEVVSGVSYLHSQNIVHRNIQLQNILLGSQDDYPIVKITDFRLAKKMKKLVSTVKTVLSANDFRAPELTRFRGSHFDTRADVYSLGVLLYFCLCGEKPFLADSRNENSFGSQSILLFHPEKIWCQISVNPKFIIRKALMFDFQKRPYTRAIKTDSWFLMKLAEKRPIQEFAQPSKRLRVSSNCR